MSVRYAFLELTHIYFFNLSYYMICKYISAIKSSLYKTTIIPFPSINGGWENIVNLKFEFSVYFSC